MKRHIILDFETLSTGADPFVFQAAAICFDDFGNEVTERFNEVVNIKTNQEITTDGNTLNWWINNEERFNLFKEITNTPTCDNEESLFTKLKDYITIKYSMKQSKECFNADYNNVGERLYDSIISNNTREKNSTGKIDDLEIPNKHLYLWGNGILFDNKIFKDKLDKYDLGDYPISYKNDRDLRTLIEDAREIKNMSITEFYSLVDKTKYKSHDALQDCLYELDCWKMAKKIIREAF